MVVNTCNVAVALDIEKSLIPYSTVDCLNRTEALKHAEDIRLNYKIMTRSFNPHNYEKNRELDLIIQRRFTTDVTLTQSLSMKFSVVESEIRFFDSWLLDLRDFSFFLKRYLNNSPDQQI
jgi:hypothetical protein